MISHRDMEKNAGPAAMRAVGLLENAGFEAWIVGGCLRDWFLGRECHDVDITTSASPQETEAVFSGCRRIETGIAHGTVTVLVDGQPLEITTYRVDGAYEDHRRPSEVRFTSRLEEDLARRDFTVNAMAWNPQRGLADPFGGQRDLERNVLRCVGEARRRFEEDALRILRALRFAAVYGFGIESATAAAMESERKWLRFVSAERSFAELKKTLASSGAAAVMGRYGSLWQWALSEFPEVTPEALEWMKALTAPKPKKLAAVGASEQETALLRLTLLLNGDLERTKRLARQAKMSRAEEGVLTEAARLWNRELPKSDGGWKRWIYEDGYDAVLRAIAVRKARSCAAAFQCGDAVQGKEACGCEEADYRYDEAVRRIKAWRTNGECVTLAQLAIDGNVLLERGVPAGKRIKEMLERALFAVMDGEVENEPESLLRYLEL